MLKSKLEKKTTKLESIGKEQHNALNLIRKTYNKYKEIYQIYQGCYCKKKEEEKKVKKYKKITNNIKRNKSAKTIGRNKNINNFKLNFTYKKAIKIILKILLKE